MNCKHWTSCNIKGGGCCAINKHGGRPSLGVCGQCDQRRQPLHFLHRLKPRFLRFIGKAKCCGGTGATPVYKWAAAEWYGWPMLLRWRRVDYPGCGCLCRLKDWREEIRYA